MTKDVEDDQLRDSGQVPVAAEAARHKKRLRRGFIGLQVRRHRLVLCEESTKTLRGALALVTRRKLLHQIRGMTSSRISSRGLIYYFCH
jgi:hypothetical protein